PTLFHVGEILVVPIALRHRPARAVAQQPFFILLGKFGDRALRTDAGRNERKEDVDDARQFLFDLLEDQTGLHQAYASIDVVADAAGRDDAVVEIHRRDATDGKAVAPVNVRHGERIADDAREMRHVHHLAQTIIFLKSGHESFRAIDTPRHLQATLASALPTTLSIAF